MTGSHDSGRRRIPSRQDADGIIPAAEALEGGEVVEVPVVLKKFWSDISDLH
jgi:hypothetical protein